MFVYDVYKGRKEKKRAGKMQDDQTYSILVLCFSPHY
jgi:hypothetical protein